MPLTPWLTSDDIIAEVERRISVPLHQETFDEDDILAFANAEMLNSQVPSMMEYHEEYFVTKKVVPLVQGRVRYAIPDRAIGMKLRDLFYQDSNSNMIAMVRINADDQDIYSNGSQAQSYSYYLEGNDVVLTATDISSPTGSLVFSFYLRPNKLVQNDKAAIVSSFQKQITVNNTTLIANDSLSINGITFTAVLVAANPTQFAIGLTDIITATNLVNAINANDDVGTASNSTPATAVVSVTYSDRNMEFISYNSTALAVSEDLNVICTEDVPSNIVNGTDIDFLQTKAGHKTYSYDITLSDSAISGNTFTILDTDVPEDFIVGDYICSSYECIIPQIPSDLHSLLAERTCARILSSQGDLELLGQVDQKLAELEKRQGNLIDQRVTGSPMKIVNRYSALKAGKARYWNS